MDGDKPIIIDSLYQKYSHKLLLKDINIAVGKGEIFALLGPNASGKSTTFNVLTGNISRTCGIISFRGKEG